MLESRETTLSQGALPIRIGIMGTPVDSGNRGVLALGAALAKLCMEAVPNGQVLLFGSHRTGQPVVMRPLGVAVSIPMINWRLSPRSSPRDHLFMIVLMSLLYRRLPFTSVRRRIAASIPWIKALESTKIVGDVRGGDSFSDIYGLERFIIATLPILSVIWVKGGIVQFPQTYGPFKGRVARGIARFILRRSTVVIARDLQSQQVAQDLLGKDRQVLLSPDVAFALHVEAMPAVQVDPPLSAPLPAGLIGLNVNGLMFNGGYTRKNMFGLKLDYQTFLPKLVEALLAEHPGELLIVPHTFAPPGDTESDNDASVKLREMLPPALQSRVRIVTAEYDAHQLKGIIGQCDFFVGSRMHSCIAALSQGVPCVGVAYSMKFRGVFESVGMADWVVDARDFDNETAVEAIVGLYRERELRRSALAIRAVEAKEKLKMVFGGLLNSQP